MAVPAKTLSNDCLTLCAIDVERDAPEWYIAMQEPDMHWWTGHRVPHDIDEVRELLAGYNAHPSILAWCIRDGHSGTMVGTYWLAVPYMADGKRISVDAQRIAKPFWRTGRTMAARRLVYRYAFEDLSVEELHASAWEQNVNSCRSMEGAGFELVDVVARFNPKYGKELNERHYVLTRAQWHRVCCHLP
ncbi:MAG: N-acetyltransferase [Sulfobacillus thermosulfidooxidans]|nr:MAG: N-acetyltransferase [Sulfobacillus thermosulfidooxidans]